MSILGGSALDINVAEADLCLILGYLSTPGRVGLVEAQIPEDKTSLFRRQFPNQEHYEISQGETAGGHVMKRGCQLRVYLNTINNCPDVLLPYLGVGTGRFIKRINKGKFVEKLVDSYGFSFGRTQDIYTIRTAIQARHPQHMAQFEVGFNL